MLCPRGAFSLMAVVGIVAACDDAQDAGPTAPQFQLSGLVCKPATVQKLARSLFGSGTPGLTAAQQITTNQTANVSYVFTIFSEIEKKAAGGLSGSPKSYAANLTVQSLACAAVVSSDTLVRSLQDTMKFGKALELKGAYAVRGLSAADDNLDVKSHNADLSETGASGVRPPAEGFLAWQGGKVLFYGYPRAGFSSESAATPSGRVAFEWFTVKPLTAATNGDLSGIVGICVNVPSSEDALKLRVQHEQTIIPISSFQVCPSTGSLRLDPARTGRPLTGLEWFAQTFFAPTELHAATLLLTTSPGGTAKKFSPYEVVNPDSVQLAFVHQPADGFVNRPIPSTDAGFPITVSATGKKGTRWQGVLIRIFGINNNGLKVPFSTDTATTDSTGLAVFPLVAAPKTGGYSIYALTQPTNDADVAAFAPDTVAAAQRINIRP